MNIHSADRIPEKKHEPRKAKYTHSHRYSVLASETSSPSYATDKSEQRSNRRGKQKDRIVQI